MTWNNDLKISNKITISKVFKILKGIKLQKKEQLYSIIAIYNIIATTVMLLDDKKISKSHILMKLAIKKCEILCYEFDTYLLTVSARVELDL